MMATDETGYGAPMIGAPSVREQLATATAAAHGEHKCGWCSEMAVLAGTDTEMIGGRPIQKTRYACYDHIRDARAYWAKLRGGARLEWL